MTFAAVAELRMKISRRIKVSLVEWLSHRRRMVLILAAIFVPYVALIVLSVQVINQDRGLSAVRRADRQRQVVSHVRQELLERLEAIKRDEIRTELKPGERYRHPEVVLVGWVEQDKLVLPWETDYAARMSRELLADKSFESVIGACEHAEFGSGEAIAAAQCYEHAADAATIPVQVAYARLLGARALDEAGRHRQAAALFETLLSIGAGITDEDGIPVALHAAQWLVQAGSKSPRILDTVQAVLSARPWATPASCFLASEISERMVRIASGVQEARQAEELRRQVAALVRLTEQAQWLDNDLPHLGLVRPAGPPAWSLYGEDPWLIGTAPAGPDRTTVIVVRARDLLQPLEARLGLRFSDARDPRGELLGAAFPGLKVTFVTPDNDAGERTARLERRLYYFALLLMAAATSFSGYLLWRDLRRDLRLSELRSQFVSSVSHELKTPLTAIRMLAETLQMGRVRDPGMQAEYLDTITNECERLSRLVDEVLLFSKTEQGKKIYRFRPVQLEDTVHAAARAMEYPLRQKGFALHMQVETGLPPVRADEDALEQAILNLMSNAMKYSGDSRDIELALRRENGYTVIRVADQGVGIPLEAQTHIFENFYRAPTRENQLIPGTGLGLALVAQIVKAHGGKVRVESVLGKGSTFSICLPVENQA